jgi:hypothetical protein
VGGWQGRRVTCARALSLLNESIEQILSDQILYPAEIRRQALTAPHQKFRLSLDRKSRDSLIYTHSSTSLRFFFTPFATKHHLK